MQSLLYISSALMAGPDTHARIAALVDAAKRRNAKLEVTGSLLFTGRRFAQILEGKAQAIDTLMHSITADRRHTDVRVVEMLPLAERRFDSWSLAYAGQAQYVAHHIERVTQCEPGWRGHAIGTLRRLMSRFHNAGGVVENRW